MESNKHRKAAFLKQQKHFFLFYLTKCLENKRLKKIFDYFLDSLFNVTN